MNKTIIASLSLALATLSPADTLFTDFFDYVNSKDFTGPKAPGPDGAGGWTTVNGVVGNDIGITPAARLWGNSASLEYNHPAALSVVDVGFELVVDVAIARSGGAYPYNTSIILWDGVDDSTKTVVASDSGSWPGGPGTRLRYMVLASDLGKEVIFTYGHGNGWGETDNVAFSTTAPVGISWDPADDDNGGAGEWNTSALFWQFVSGTSPNQAWTPNDGTQTARFEGSGGLVTLTEAISALEISIISAGYTFSGSSMTVERVAAAQDAAIASSLVGTAPLSKTGVGTLSLTGDGSGFTDTLTVAQGRLNLSGSIGGSVLVEDTTSLGGEGAISGDLQLGSSGGIGATLVVDVDTSPGTLSVDDLTLEGITNVNFEGTVVFGSPIPMLSYSGTLSDNSGGATLSDAFAVTPASRKTVVDNANTLEITLEAPETSIWDNGSGSGFWSFGDIAGDANWTSSDSLFYNGDSVTFDDNNPGTIELDDTDGALSPASVVFANTGINDYSLTQAAISGPGSLTVNGGGTVTFEQKNRYTGGTSVGNGSTLSLTTGGQVGAIVGTATVAGAGSILKLESNSLGYGDGQKVDTLNIFDGALVDHVGIQDNCWGIVVNLRGASMTTVNGTGTEGDIARFSFGNDSSLNSLASSDTSEISGLVRLRQELLVIEVENGAAATDLLVSADIQAQGGAFGITKTGDGTLSLTGVNTYPGTTTVSGGVLSINGTSLADVSRLVIDGGEVEPLGTEIVDTLFFGAVQQTSGTWGATDSGAENIDDLHFSGSAGVVDVTTGPAGYESWASGFAGFTDSDPELDFENDGLASGIEWVVVGDPTTNDAAGITPTFDNASNPDNFRYTYRRGDEANADPNTAIVVEYGSDLSGWTTATQDVDGVSITVLDDGFGPGIDRVTVSIPKALALTGKLFVRLSVSLTTP